MREQTESEVQRQCIEFLKANGIFHWRQNTGVVKKGNRYIRFSEKGVSDIIGITKDGRFLAIECKRNKGGVVSAEQVHFLSTIKRNGGVAIVASSLEQLIVELKKNGVIV